MESPGSIGLGAGQAACGCWSGAWWGVNPPPRCAMHSVGMFGLFPVAAAPSLPFAPRLSDEDVERIAKRVAELMRAPGG